MLSGVQLPYSRYRFPNTKGSSIRSVWPSECTFAGGKFQSWEAEGYLFSKRLPSPKLRGKAPENGWLEYDRFLVGPGLFSGAMLVSGSVITTVIVSPQDRSGNVVFPFQMAEQLHGLYLDGGYIHLLKPTPTTWRIIPSFTYIYHEKSTIHGSVKIRFKTHQSYGFFFHP